MRCALGYLACFTSFTFWELAPADPVCVMQLWPGAVNFPDFMNPKTVSWWQDQMTVSTLPSVL